MSVSPEALRSTPQERGWPEWRCAEPLVVIRITAPHFVAGVVPFRGRVVNAAPILRYMTHWSGKRVADYCKSKGWAWERIEQRADAPIEWANARNASSATRSDSTTKSEG